jgi:hypothetical protein
MVDSFYYKPNKNIVSVFEWLLGVWITYTTNINY